MTMLLEFLERHRARHLFRSSHLKDVRAKNFYNTDFFHTLAAVRE